MKCPYCNKTLSPIIFGGDLTCKNEKCTKSNGMVGTQPMWEKVASLVKIRNANITYRRKPETKKKICERRAERCATDPEYKKKLYEQQRKWREENKDKVAERNKKYRETHKEYYKEYYKEYMKKYNQRKKDNK